ncbi:type II toxin-antitoxin system HicB family antitoxin [Aquipseudomonas alcaligenes]|uniref:type II toxin-antitoxin system HicB family antitoxin n=1 Tax=Aquipseudomonas alcaligenes TaxID=43263 RepID=UPI000970CD09|nr:type II toxin-antitoxin system HicB family antitoxin [Pseudomonas alcaligenes]
MTDKVLTYKGYQGSIEASIDDGVLYGSILHIVDKVTYEAESIVELKKEFEASVDYYLAHCAKKGIEPNKPFSGTFNVRVGMEVHKRAVFHSRKNDVSLNDLVKNAIVEYINRHDSPREVHHHHHYEFTGAIDVTTAQPLPRRPKPDLRVVTH